MSPYRYYYRKYLVGGKILPCHMSHPCIGGLVIPPSMSHVTWPGGITKMVQYSIYTVWFRLVVFSLQFPFEMFPRICIRYSLYLIVMATWPLVLLITYLVVHVILL
jgi:hypothetical protein